MRRARARAWRRSFATRWIRSSARSRVRPRVHFVTMLPKTRSGKLLRRAIAALAEGRDPGELPTIEDPGALMQVREALGN